MDGHGWMDDGFGLSQQYAPSGKEEGRDMAFLSITVVISVWVCHSKGISAPFPVVFTLCPLLIMQRDWVSSDIGQPAT